jgi:selenocysteine lyase/cysteine desulfurase
LNNSEKNLIPNIIPTMNSLEDLRIKLRGEFPPLEKKIAFLDNAAGSLVPRRVIDAISDVLTSRGVCNSMMSYE